MDDFHPRRKHSHSQEIMTYFSMKMLFLRTNGFHKFDSYYFKESFFWGGGSNMALEVGQVACPNTISFIMAFSKLSSMKVIQVK